MARREHIRGDRLRPCYSGVVDARTVAVRTRAALVDGAEFDGAFPIWPKNRQAPALAFAVRVVFGHIPLISRFSSSRLASCSVCLQSDLLDKARLAPGFEMPLTLAMLRCPDDVAPETRMVSGGEFSIGRGSENDWVLPDPERSLSKQHCVLAFRSGGWQIADCSTNGTFLNRETDPIGRGRMRELRSGDRLSFGAYEIELHVDDDAAMAWRPVAAAEPLAARQLGSSRNVRARPLHGRFRSRKAGACLGPVARRRIQLRSVRRPTSRRGNYIAGGFRPARAGLRRPGFSRPDPVGSLSASRERVLAAGREVGAARGLESGNRAAEPRAGT